jgi:hypothetical protein
MATVRGGKQYEKALRDIVRMLGHRNGVRVGFLEGATYPDGKPVAMIAAIQEYGAPRANIPSRPFFRNMIAAKSPEWPKAIAKLLRDNRYDARVALEITGQAIAGQLRQSIIDTNDPPLSPITIRRKGFSKPLIDTGVMINSIDSEVF